MLGSEILGFQGFKRLWVEGFGVEGFRLPDSRVPGVEEVMGSRIWGLGYLIRGGAQEISRGASIG